MMRPPFSISRPTWIANGASPLFNFLNCIFDSLSRFLRLTVNSYLLTRRQHLGSSILTAKPRCRSLGGGLSPKKKEGEHVQVRDAQDEQSTL